MDPAPLFTGFVRGRVGSFLAYFVQSIACGWGLNVGVEDSKSSSIQVLVDGVGRWWIEPVSSWMSEIDSRRVWLS